jgi:heterotetrameric sarcosine oxidase gamma subunit
VSVADRHDTDGTAGRQGVAAPVARSPISMPGPRELLDGWEVATRTSSAELTVSDASRLTKVLLRAPAAGAAARVLPARGRADRDGPVLRVGSGPGEWLLLAAGRPADSVAEQVLPAAGAEFVSWVDLTHGRALVRLTGATAARALAKVSAVNLADAVTPDGTAFRTSVASVTTDVVRDDRDGTLSYLLHCERSSGQFLLDALLDAGAEFGVEAAGPAGREI